MSLLRLFAVVFCLTLAALQAEPEPRRIAVFVGLCDNATQGIVKVGAKIGDGDKPDDNLYWGCTDGLKSCFKASKQWKLEKREAGEATGDPRILERLTFRHTKQDAVLVAEAWRGAKLLECFMAFEQAAVAARSDLVVFIGHNALMDFPLDPPAAKAPRQIDTMVLCCKSDPYCRQRLEKLGTRPVLLTSQLMYPGSFLLRDSLEPWLEGKPRTALRTAAGAAYAKNQNIKVSAAEGVFAKLEP